MSPCNVEPIDAHQERPKHFRILKSFKEDGTEYFETVKYHFYDESQEPLFSSYEEAYAEGLKWAKQPELKDHEWRLVGEYHDLVVKLGKLQVMLDNYDTLAFKPECSKKELTEQCDAMAAYLTALTERTDFKRLVELDYIKLGEKTDV